MQAEFGSPAARNLYRLAIHLALVVGAIIFSMPFVWMVCTSLKEDDEQMTDQIVWLPRLPPEQFRSPYLDSREGTTLVAPREMDEQAWAAVEPLVRQTLDQSIAAAGSLSTGFTDPAHANELLRAAVWRDIYRRIHNAKFADPALLSVAVAAEATPEQVAKSHRRIYRGIALGELSLRAEGQSQVRFSPREGGSGSLIWRTGEALQHQVRTLGTDKREEVQYEFAAAGQRGVMHAEVSFDALDQLKSMSVSLNADATWNRLWYAIEFEGKRYESTEPFILSGKRFVEAFYQLPSPDDTNDLRIRHWITTRAAEGAGFFNVPGKARIEVAIENTSGWTKAMDKFSYNYSQALRYIPFWRYVLTSLFLVFMNVTLAILSSSLVAFAFARLNWPGREICWALLLATVMIPSQVTMIPNFLIMKWLGWFNTLRPLWIGSAFGSVFFIFMLRQFMKGIPKDLEDAARIDGCSYWQIYWHVVLPLVKPTLAAIGIFTFMGTWNDFMGPLMYLSDQRYYPLSLGLFSFQTVAGGNQGMLMAASLMMTLPVIALFFVAQKQFIQGVAFSGIKG